ncbi:hypothetical protein AB0E01_13820 [Nocardia vinacea]|uniref:hypothetical protein n=1 Tax=Nocardia vinacea TaxID=96468 RepID=UPI00340EA791
MSAAPTPHAPRTWTSWSRRGARWPDRRTTGSHTSRLPDSPALSPAIYLRLTPTTPELDDYDPSLEDAVIDG